MSARLEDLASSFRRDLRAEGRADRTATIYLQSVRFFSAWLAERGRPATIDELERAAIRAWLADLSEHVGDSTLRTRFKGLRRFCRWLHSEGEIEADPMTGMEVPKVVDRPVPLLSDGDLAALVKACSGSDFRCRRNEALVRFLLDTGCRVSELCGLTLDDLDLNGETALVVGKGRKHRTVYFGARTARALDRMLRLRAGHRFAADPHLFLSQRGPMTPDGARELLIVLGRSAGVADVRPHRFRHTWAHDYLLAGGEGQNLKRLAGWTSDVMLTRYGSAGADVRAGESVRRMRRGDRV